jgi:hypothetical protein
MTRRISFFTLVVLLLLAATPSRSLAAPRCFPNVPGIADCIDGPLRTFWEQHGGLAVFGYPLGPQSRLDSQAGPLTVQRFERVRLELHPENQPPYNVLLSRAGAEALERAGRDWNAFPRANPAAAHYFAETGHAIAPEFWGYWRSHGLESDGRPGLSTAENLALFGLPLSEAAVETNGAGDTVLTQWFERARFEYHPANPPASRVLLGLLEREVSPANSNPPAIPKTPGVPPPIAAPQAGGFVTVSGDRLLLAGQSIQVKGINYYPQGRPWAEMWEYWDGTQVERELRQARDELGINAVRVLVPFQLEGAKRDDPVVSKDLLRRMRQVNQIAGDLNLKVIVTLFDFSDTFAPAGSPDAERDLRYLHDLVGNFLGDDRILAWDIHNEPDQYPTWRNGNPQQVLGWLGRMADELHRIDRNHLVTVGMGSYENMYLPGPDGRTVLDYSDFVSLHSYNAGDVARQVGEMRARTPKPIVLGEFGWPTGPLCVVREYTEAQQAQVYQATLQAVTGRVAGVFAWTLRDFDSGPTKRFDSREEYYGLYRADGSLKPAAAIFRAYDGLPLASAIRTSEPITNDGLDHIDGPSAPILVPESGHYVKGMFRRAWDLFGGRASLGLPLSEAYERASDHIVVQYFERAVLELHPEAAAIPGFDLLLESDQVPLLVRPQPLGWGFAQGKNLPAGGSVAGRFQPFYKQFNGSWRLGAAISAELVETVDGQPRTVQYFEKGRLEWNDAKGWAEPTPLGALVFQGQCDALR